MSRLEHRRLGADVAAGRHAEAADHAGAEVGDDVAVEVRQHDHVVLLGARHELVAEVVDDPVLELDVRVVLRDLARDVEVEAVGVLHDVGLVGRGHLAAAVLARVVERRAHDPLGAEDGDRLDRDARVIADLRAVELRDELDQLLRLLAVVLELDPRIEVLGVLAHDHDVRLGEARAHALVCLAGTDAGVDVVLLASSTLTERKPEPTGVVVGPYADAVALDRLERAAREGIALLVVDVLARGMLVPGEPDTGRLEHAAGRFRQLGTGAVTRDEGDFVCHLDLSSNSGRRCYATMGIR